MHVTAKSHTVTVKALHLTDVHTCHGVDGVKGVRTCLYHRLDDRHDVTVGVLDHIHTVFLTCLADHGKIGRDELIEHSGREEGTGVVAVVGAKEGHVETCLVLTLVGFNGGKSHTLCLCLYLLGLVGKAVGEFIHIRAVRDGEGAVTVTAKETGIAEMLAQTLAEGNVHRGCHVPPLGAVYGNDGIVKSGLGVLHGVTGQHIAAHFNGGLVAVHTGILVSEIVSRFFKLRCRQLGSLLAVKTGIVQGITEKFLGKLKFQLKGRHFIGCAKGERGNGTLSRCPDLTHSQILIFCIVIIPFQGIKDYLTPR